MNKTYIGVLPNGAHLHGKRYNYEIIEVLGQGSFGITYLAKATPVSDNGEIEIFVAIKEFFMREINDRENNSVRSTTQGGLHSKYRKKFVEESSHLEELRHSNIVKVLESFEENGTNYYTMQFIDGGSLNDYISRRGSLKEREALLLAQKIASALDYMHTCNMLHLDLKPSNVMMQDGTPILIDFGLSKQYDDSGNPETSTAIGGGTPGYAPLEQLNASINPKEALPVSMDIYALGATIFKMLTGQKPPIASEILNNGFPDDELRLKGVTRATRELVKSMMSPVKNQRPKNMQHVRMNISNILDGNSNDDATQINNTATSPNERTVLTSTTATTQRINQNPIPQPSIQKPGAGKKKSNNSGIIIILTLLIIIIGLIISVLTIPNCTGNNYVPSNDANYIEPSVSEDSTEENEEVIPVTEESKNESPSLQPSNKEPEYKPRHVGNTYRGSGSIPNTKGFYMNITLNPESGTVDGYYQYNNINASLALSGEIEKTSNGYYIQMTEYDPDYNATGFIEGNLNSSTGYFSGTHYNYEHGKQRKCTAKLNQ